MADKCLCAAAAAAAAAEGGLLFVVAPLAEREGLISFLFFRERPDGVEAGWIFLPAGRMGEVSRDDFGELADEGSWQGCSNFLLVGVEVLVSG